VLFSASGETATVRCRISTFPLPEGRYLIKAQLMRRNEVLDFPVRGVGYLDVTSGDYYGTGTLPTRLTRTKPQFLIAGEWSMD
jgi:hypothetical protein